MATIVSLFLAFVFIAGLILIVAPAIVLDEINAQARTAGIRIGAVLIRAILGVALVVLAPDTQYPTIIYFVGALFVVAAIVIAVMPKENFADLILWASKLPHSLVRIAGVFLLGVLWYLPSILL